MRTLLFEFVAWLPRDLSSVSQTERSLINFAVDLLPELQAQGAFSASDLQRLLDISLKID